jgi:hypothetical protein
MNIKKKWDFSKISRLIFIFWLFIKDLRNTKARSRRLSEKRKLNARSKLTAQAQNCRPNRF